MATSQHPEAFVRWLRQVAPYVHAFRGRTFVVAFGGEMFAERARFLSFVHDLNLLAALGRRSRLSSRRAACARAMRRGCA
jgi:amino-acid N-acetyltransferase